jgi:calcineurin-like phosphoesterase family protein
MPKQPKKQAVSTSQALSNSVRDVKPASSPVGTGPSRLVPGWRPLPFLETPAEFQDRFPVEELARRQSGQLIPVPAPLRNPPVMQLTEVIGTSDASDIEHSGQIVIHTVGDTGRGLHSDETDVAQAMALDYHKPNPADHPAFFLHLGDVCYSDFHGAGSTKAGLYKPQFYLPYADYPGKILAIPGNHDSNPEEDPKSIEAFEANFCAPPTAVADAASNREPMHQPGVYFLLEAPFVRILGLFSNGGETQGVITGPVTGDSQKNFLIAQLKQIKKKRAAGDTSALLLAVHHPPYSGGGHTGSKQMSNDFDDAFRQAGLAPDAVLSGHAHNYQRFTRKFSLGAIAMDIPYIVAGGGGHGITPVKPRQDRSFVMTPLVDVSGESSLQQYYNGFGYVMVTVTQRVLTIDFYPVHPQPAAVPLDSVTLSLRTHTITNETRPLEHPLSGEGRRRE